MPLGFDDIEKVFSLIELINDPDFITEIAPNVKDFVVRENFFTNPHLRMEYMSFWDEVVARQVKRQIIKHLDLTPEEIMLVCDVTFLKSIAPALFNKENYAA